MCLPDQPLAHMQSASHSSYCLPVNQVRVDGHVPDGSPGG